MLVTWVAASEGLVPAGCVDLVEWNSRIEWWNGIVEWWNVHAHEKQGRLTMYQTTSVLAELSLVICIRALNVKLWLLVRRLRLETAVLSALSL